MLNVWWEQRIQNFEKVVDTVIYYYFLSMLETDCLISSESMAEPEICIYSKCLVEPEP